MKRLLVVDDDAGMRAVLETRFRRQGWAVDVAVNGGEALKKFRSGLHTLVITDVRMPGRDGFEVMREIQMSSPRTAVILLTAYGGVPEAVEAMRNGACDYLVKPVSFEKLERAVEQVLQRAQEQSRASESLVGRSPAWQLAVDHARQAAETDADVLIEAESGTGKEMVARLIHRLSKRREGPFVALNCAAFPEALLESELFGHARGAFTGAFEARPGKFEMASGGTLLLDEVGEMPLALQPKLLRALQEREFDRLGSNQTVRVDIRVIATTNRPLESAVQEGRFRADLYYRLNVIPLALPPLRERRSDVRELAEYFVRLYATPGNEPPRLAPELVARLEERPWPGNVRELANFMRRAVALSSGGEIGMEAFGYGKTPPSSAAPVPDWKPGLSLNEMERRLFAMTLEATGGNRARAAELLGVSLRTVRNKVREYAKFRIRGAILDSLRDLDWSPRELRRKGRLVESVYAQLSGRLGRAPTENELAREMGLELHELQSLLAELDGLELGSLHVDSSRDGRDEDLTEHLAGDPEENPFTSCLRSEMKSLLQQAISELPEKERQVLALYYYEELTMKEIGAILGVGESRVSQIHSLAMVRLRTRLNGVTAPHEPQGRARAAGAV